MKLENIPGYPGYYVSKFGKVYSKHSGKWTRLPIKKWGNNYTVHLIVMVKGKLFKYQG